MAARGGLPAGDLIGLVKDNVRDSPLSVLRPICEEVGLLQDQDGHAVAPYGVLVGMVFASVSRASYGKRKAWLQSLDWGQIHRVFGDLVPWAHL